jgi:hypothetical protein
MWQFPLEIQGEPVATMEGLVRLMRRQLQQWDAARDNRAAFLRVYTTMTDWVRQKRSDSFFLDPDWIERVAVRFGWYYFHALTEWEAGRRAPPAWTFAFERARQRRNFVLQDILLGMNAHINNDLALVVWELLRSEGDGADRFRSIRRRFDHDQINRILEMVLPTAEKEVAIHYGRGISPLGKVMGHLDESLAVFGLITYRDKVWQNGQFLLAARNERERAQVIHWIESDALAVAQAIDQFGPLRPFKPFARLARRLRLF